MHGSNYNGMSKNYSLWMFWPPSQHLQLSNVIRPVFQKAALAATVVENHLHLSSISYGERPCQNGQRRTAIAGLTCNFTSYMGYLTLFNGHSHVSNGLQNIIFNENGLLLFSLSKQIMNL